MNYHGPLYGKIGTKYFDTSKTSKDFDEMVEMLQSAQSTIGRIRRSISIHPDCTENSEFADYVNLAHESEEKIEKLLTQTK